MDTTYIKKASEETIESLIKMGILYRDESGIIHVSEISTADGQSEQC